MTRILLQCRPYLRLMLVLGQETRSQLGQDLWLLLVQVQHDLLFTTLPHHLCMSSFLPVHNPDPTCFQLNSCRCVLGLVHVTKMDCLECIWQHQSRQRRYCLDRQDHWIAKSNCCFRIQLCPIFGSPGLAKLALTSRMRISLLGLLLFFEMFFENRVNKSKQCMWMKHVSRTAREISLKAFCVN